MSQAVCTRSGGASHEMIRLPDSPLVSAVKILDVVQKRVLRQITRVTTRLHCYNVGYRSETISSCKYLKLLKLVYIHLNYAHTNIACISFVFVCIAHVKWYICIGAICLKLIIFQVYGNDYFTYLSNMTSMTIGLTVCLPMRINCCQVEVREMGTGEFPAQMASNAKKFRFDDVIMTNNFRQQNSNGKPLSNKHIRVIKTKSNFCCFCELYWFNW